MNSLDFQNGLDDAAELCEREAPKRKIVNRRDENSEAAASFDTIKLRRAAQACREAVKLREVAEAALNMALTAALQAGWIRPVPEFEQLRRALGK